MSSLTFWSHPHARERSERPCRLRRWAADRDVSTAITATVLVAVPLVGRQEGGRFPIGFREESANDRSRPNQAVRPAYAKLDEGLLGWAERGLNA